MNMIKLRNQVRNVLSGRMFETLAFCVMYFMVIGILSMFICSITTCFFIRELDKVGVLVVITISAAITLYSFLVIGKNKVMFKIINGDMFYFSELFTGVKYGVKAMGIILSCSLSVILWSCLFIVPGIIKGISYSMALYVLAKNPEKSVNECISESKRIMKVNKVKFFKIYSLAMSKVVVISLVTILPYVICVAQTSNIILLMFITFAFVLIYPILLFVVITYSELTTAIFYERICEENIQSEEKEEVIGEKLCGIRVEVA